MRVEFSRLALRRQKTLSPLTLPVHGQCSRVAVLRRETSTQKESGCFQLALKTSAHVIIQFFFPAMLFIIAFSLPVSSQVSYQVPIASGAWSIRSIGCTYPAA
jgi:hypothetical protein